MNIKATKTPLLIAAIATAVTLTAFVPANAKAYWVSGSDNSVQAVSYTHLTLPTIYSV